MVRESLNTLATQRCRITVTEADEAPLPALQAANGKPSVDGLRQWSDPELQDTMRRLSSNPEDRSRLASALSCLKSASEAGKQRWRGRSFMWEIWVKKKKEANKILYHRLIDFTSLLVLVYILYSLIWCTYVAPPTPKVHTVAEVALHTLYWRKSTDTCTLLLK